ncbi:MAG: polymer-forming cytoskeletal protein [Candidatus Hydrogenedentes bacterium]|nr:polymer-forming cytoskeletal protein [Candidatus Hydrogenedentota bacterium]
MVTIIGQGTTVIGELKSKGTIRIEGVVSGRIHSDDTIVVQDSGRVKADLYAGQITISGEVEGNVFAQDRLEITTNGKLVGDIVAPRVSIAEGVLFEGKCTMKPPQQPAGAAPAAAQSQPQQAPRADAGSPTPGTAPRGDH